MKMYPRDYKPNKKIPLQSYLFGHRIQGTQTKYEYLIEFLQVAVSPKEVGYSGKPLEGMFPVDDEHCDYSIKYYPDSRIGLKRFIFFSKSKLDGKAKVDQIAYEQCLKEIEAKMKGGNPNQRKNTLIILQTLLNGFSAVNQNRSWFDQNMLPICREVILPEGMGIKKWRHGMDFEVGNVEIDWSFDFKKYTYMCRGGEIYYLHLLNAINTYPEFKPIIEKQLWKMINSFPQFSCLCNFVQDTWEEYISIPEDEVKEKKQARLTKDLGAIPTAFSIRNYNTLTELDNFLSSKCHPFEKMEIFSNGILLQILRMMYMTAANDNCSGCWLIDVNCKGYENNEAKKAAISAFKRNEEMISSYLYSGLSELKDELPDSNDEGKIIKDAADDSYRLFRKIGKSLGIIIPQKGAGMRFTLSEDIIEFLVLSIIPPKHMITLDEFTEDLYQHFGMVIGSNQYKKEMEKDCLPRMSDLSFMEENKEAFAQKLKECGFLRNLSDATSIVENPYEKEE